MNSSTELDPLAEMNELDDLGNLFEFGDIDLNTIPEHGQYSDQMQQQHGTHPNTPFQDMVSTPPVPGTSAHDFGGDEQYEMSTQMDQMQYARRHKNHTTTSNPYVSEPLYQPSIQSTYNPYPQNFQFQAQPGFPPNHHIPPTPNSYEMHGETGRFLQQHSQLDAQQRAIFEQRYHVRKDDAIAFTPMVSPAGTPQYNMLPEYTTPGAYFSPLTSPMLHAQNQQQAQLLQQHQPQGYRTDPSTAPSSITISPIDPNMDFDLIDAMKLPESAGPTPRRSRRKITTPKNTSATSRVKEGAQKRKSMPLSSSIPHSGVEEFSSRPGTSQPMSAGLQMPPQFDSSEGDSISPEPLSESVMGPPPRPGSSLNHSPALLAQQQQSNNASTLGPAATPKSLLTMRGHQQSINSLQDATQSADQAWNGIGGLDELSLPESASTQSRRKPSLTHINTQLIPPSTDDNTPRRKTPKLGPSSTPASGRPGSAADSPAAESPLTASTPSAILADRKDGKAGRNSKKRGSMSANGSKLVSPAIVPKISPSIKPLLPEGTPLNTATQALLLASKSNYQNLLEGNHLPGVTYPDSLSTGLTSKRTSHKVAEQGRRNRINEALKEMQALIPVSSNNSASRSPHEMADDGGGGEEEKVAEGGAASKEREREREESAAAKSNSSKAATVELANEYIKKMQRDSAAQSADLLLLRRENEELRKRLAAGRQGEGSRSSAGESPDGEAEDEVR